VTLERGLDTVDEADCKNSKVTVDTPKKYWNWLLYLDH